MRWIEGVADHTALGMFARRLADTNWNARRARSENRGLRSERVHVGEQLDLKVRPLRPILLDQIHTLQRISQLGSERESLLRGAGRQTQLLKGRPRSIDILAQAL